jgi:hypothetical protein
MRLRRRIGQSAMAAITAAQFGLAIMPLCVAIFSALISGATRGTAGSIRKAEELSITTAPACTAVGAHCRAVALPVENSARSMRSKLISLSAATGRARPAKGKVLPAERGEA